MMLKVIDVLLKNLNGYFLMVEGGWIDYVLYGINVKCVFEDMVVFDEVICVVLLKVDLVNMLIVVMVDYDYMMMINGYLKCGNLIFDISCNYCDG